MGLLPQRARRDLRPAKENAPRSTGTRQRARQRWKIHQRRCQDIQRPPRDNLPRHRRITELMPVFCSSQPHRPFFADELLPKSDVGHAYAQVRLDLLKEGNSPVDQIHNPHRQCFLAEEACGMYDELLSCAVDQDAPCRLEWMSRSKRRFYIITSGSDPKTFIVMGMDYDQPGED